ncbi:MAG TPA: transcription-repair coupling factor [Actinobacteria bacterium]|nr:transcription-repair coupling factor [Actinomycetota bacterium]
MSLRVLLDCLKENDNFRRLVGDLLARENPTIFVPDPLRPYLLAGLFREVRKPFLIVVSTVKGAQELAKDMANFLPSVLLFPDWEVLPCERLSPRSEIVGRRLEVLNRLQSGSPTVTVIAVQTLMQKIPPLAAGLAEPLEMKVGQEYDLHGLSMELLRMGYERVHLVEARGHFSIRGGIVDVFPPTREHPLRIEFFGDEIESIREFMISSQRSISSLGGISIFSCRELVLNRQTAGRALDLLREKSSSGELGEDLRRLKEISYFEGIEVYSPFLHEELGTLLDYFPSGGVVILHETREIEEEATEFYLRQSKALDEAALSGSIPPPPVSYYLSPDDLFDLWSKRQQLGLVSIRTRFRERLPEFRCSSVEPMLGSIDRLERVVKELKEDFLVCIVSRDRGGAERLREVLGERGIESILCPDEFTLKVHPEGEMPLTPGKVILTVGNLSRGFIFKEAGLACLSDYDIFIKHREERRERQTRALPLVGFVDIEEGDYVVHVNHGIARYAGLSQQEVEGVVRDYMVLEYAQGDKLYVPADQVHKVSKYIGESTQPPRISRLGGREWSRAKRRVRESVKKMAFDLLTLYAKRLNSEGFSFSPDTPWQRELEDAFPFEETPDQQHAIADVKDDMEGPRPMDRLVCGDVGYGKTEVAIRATFKAVMDGKQVIVLVPTTILAQQHYNNFRERLSAFPAVVEMLSRFKSPKEQRGISADFALGKVDILIGTHRLLQRDVKAKDLGLVVVDEEQRFGVAHKEHLKNLKETVDAITLTATPIPRTLQMSLAGIRDLSIIDTPPEDRYPVYTYVGEEDEGLIQSAVRRELARGGQIYYVHNRVETIDGAARRVMELVSEARIAVAHGQMPEDDLERVMLDFLARKYDVLVCTTIIESGIDIPSVNTLIVDEANKLGLAQLYQLRGRVGRANHRAYAYFFFSDETLTSAAADRLKTIGEFTELGSGLKIALRDLEIRGAGNLLGPEQHGHIAAVGFELYCRLLQEAVEEIRGKPAKKPLEVKVDLPVNAYIPRDFITEEFLRIEAYQRIASINDLEKAKEAREELWDRYGPLPRETENLIEVCKLKVMARDAGIANVLWEEGNLLLSPFTSGEKGAASLKEFYSGLDFNPRRRTLILRGVDEGGVLSFGHRLLGDIIRLSS